MTQQIDVLREALVDAMNSMEWMANSFRDKEMPEGYARSRAAVARAALSKADKLSSGAPLHIGAELIHGRLYATVLRAEENGHVTVVATATMDEDSLRKHDCHVKMSNAEQVRNLLIEARAVLETWKDTVPAVSLCKDIDKALS